jgi:hypothetical protein
MLLDYHQLTMDEPRDSPQRKYQFRAVCAIMIVGFFYMTIPAGIFSAVKVTEGKFPGGTFIYRTTKRDYVASWGLEKSVGDDLGISPKDFEDKIYTIYLDDTWKVKNGRAQRFASGFLARSNKSDRILQDSLMARNPSIDPPSRLEIKELPAEDLWPRLRYKERALPVSKAAIVIFPSTNGFVSSLMFNFRVLPVLWKYATEKQLANGKNSPSVTIISTCSIQAQMCTHYAPLEKSEPFLLGQPRTDDYVTELPAPQSFDVMRMYKLFMKTFDWGSGGVQEL